MQRSNANEVPCITRLSDDVDDLGLHDAGVCFVFELGDTGAPQGVVAHDPGEDHRASGSRVGYELGGKGCIERISSNADPRRLSSVYLTAIHTIITMHNDTDSGNNDSHAPFMEQGNEAADRSVSSTMSDTTHTPTSPQVPSQEPGHDPIPDAASTVVAPNTPVPTSVSPATAQPDDTGEMEPVASQPASRKPGAAATPEPLPSAIEPVPFDYDHYYADEVVWSTPAEVATAAAVPPKKSRDGIMFFVGALAAALLGAALTVGMLAATGTLTTETPTVVQQPTAAPAVVSTATPAPVVENTIVNELGASVNPTAVALKAVPSIVTVITADADGNAVGSGSGVVISADGFIATNEHVVEGAQAWNVTFEDGRVYTAELIGADPLTDLAVLKIEADNLVPIDFGSAEALSLGDPAVAIGNPLGQEGGSSISVGIVSAFDRRVDFGDSSFLVGMIQTDAAINSGSSGGALVNAEGQLIGITSAIGVSNAGPEGIGYAIPVEVVQRITDEIIEEGDVNHPFLGVTIATHEIVLDDGGIIPAGAAVATVEGTDSAAAVAGLQPDDVIVRIGDKEILSQNDLILAVRLYRVGDEVEFVALRNGVEQTFTVVMGQRPAEFGG